MFSFYKNFPHALKSLYKVVILSRGQLDPQGTFANVWRLFQVHELAGKGCY